MHLSRTAAVVLLLTVTACNETDPIEPPGAGDNAAGDSSAAGDSNAGDSANAGDSNAGDSNAGDSNAGDSNAGDANPGDSSGQGDDTGGDPVPVAPHGDCSDSTDCGGRACTAVPDVGAGWHTCVRDITEAASCIGAFDECCDTSECTDGAICLQGPLWYCGGKAPIAANVCRAAECTTDDDCTASADGLCIPKGAFGEHVARCVYGDCTLDSECSDRAGGQCMPFFNPCNRRLIAFNCTYDDSPCRADKDCSGMLPYCQPGTNGATTCETFMPPP